MKLTEYFLFRWILGPRASESDQIGRAAGQESADGGRHSVGSFRGSSFHHRRGDLRRGGEWPEVTVPSGGVPLGQVRSPSGAGDRGSRAAHSAALPQARENSCQVCLERQGYLENSTNACLATHHGTNCSLFTAKTMFSVNISPPGPRGESAFTGSGVSDPRDLGSFSEGWADSCHWARGSCGQAPPRPSTSGGTWC